MYRAWALEREGCLYVCVCVNIMSLAGIYVNTCIRMILFVNLPQSTNYCEYSWNIQIHLLKILTLLLCEALEDNSCEICAQALVRSDLNTWVIPLLGIWTRGHGIRYFCRKYIQPHCLVLDDNICKREKFCEENHTCSYRSYPWEFFINLPFRKGFHKNKHYSSTSWEDVLVGSEDQHFFTKTPTLFSFKRLEVLGGSKSIFLTKAGVTKTVIMTPGFRNFIRNIFLEVSVGANGMAPGRKFPWTNCVKSSRRLKSRILSGFC